MRTKGSHATLVLVFYSGDRVMRERAFTGDVDNPVDNVYNYL